MDDQPTGDEQPQTVDVVRNVRQVIKSVLRFLRDITEALARCIDDAEPLENK